MQEKSFLQTTMAATSKIIFVLHIFFFFFFFITPSHQYHPLDSLTPSEFTQIQSIVKKAYPKPTHNLTFHYVGLEKPTKQIVLSWLKNETTTNPPRQAFVIARVNNETHEIIVDLSQQEITSKLIFNGYGYPSFTAEEQEDANMLVLAYPPFVASIRKRGLKLERVVCESFTVGWFGEERRTKRIVKVMCYYADGTVSLYMRPIEGITTIVDLEEMKIIGFSDRVTVPVPKSDGTEYRESELKPPFMPKLKGITVVQPDGPSFSIDGSQIR